MPIDPYRPPAYSPDRVRDTFEALGWRTTLASVAIGIAALMSFVVDIATLVLGDAVNGPEPSVGSALVVAAAGGALVLATLSAMLSFLIWIHRAAKNLRGLGRHGMRFSPGWCVGWFFIPLAHLVKPFQAMQEIWRASDPDATDGYWQHAPTPPLMAFWWITWLLGGMFGNVSARIHDASVSGTVGLMGSLLHAAAAVSIVSVMHRIAARQGATAAQVQQLV